MKRKNLIRGLAWVGGVVVVLSVAVGGVLGVLLYPWLALPDEPESVIATRWQKAEAMARVPEPSGDDRLLLEAAEAMRGFDPPRATKGDVPYLGRDQLTKPQETALDSLSRWFQAGAHYVPPECLGRGRRENAALPSFRLGQAALYTAHDAEDLPQVEAVLALAQQQRQVGRLVDMAIGFSLADTAARWSKQRSVAFPPRFERYRPKVAEIRGGIARDVVCIHGMMTGGTPPMSLAPGHGSGPPLGIVRMKRERLVYEQTHGRLLEFAEGTGNDWKKMAAEYERVASDHPKSVLLEAIGFYGPVIEKAGQNTEHYDTLVPKP